jgi:hypothetical protein
MAPLRRSASGSITCMMSLLVCATPLETDTRGVCTASAYGPQGSFDAFLLNYTRPLCYLSRFPPVTTTHAYYFCCEVCRTTKELDIRPMPPSDFPRRIAASCRTPSPFSALCRSASTCASKANHTHSGASRPCSQLACGFTLPNGTDRVCICSQLGKTGETLYRRGYF